MQATALRAFVVTTFVVTGAVLVAAAAIGGRSVPSGNGGSPGDGGSPGPAGSRALVAPLATPPSPDGSIAYGLVEPAVALPGAESASDREAWSQIRADIVGSGGCWLRSDLNSWLGRALDAFTWLGTPMDCSASAGSPVKILAILDDQTIWDARILCPTTTFSPAFRAHKADFTLDDWTSLVRCLARRYAGRISAYEIWNEPLLPNSMFGYQDGSATHYFDLLRSADLEIKAADPNAPVIALGGSDIFAGGDRPRLTSMRTFTDQLVALGAASYADAISLHAYPWGRHDEAVWDSYRAELRFQADAWKKPVWITETGQRASDEWTQSAYLEAAYDLFIRAGVRHLFWFSVTDQRDGDFGVRGRPVESAMRSFALAHPNG